MSNNRVPITRLGKFYGEEDFFFFRGRPWNGMVKR